MTPDCPACGGSLVTRAAQWPFPEQLVCTGCARYFLPRELAAGDFPVAAPSVPLADHLAFARLVVSMLRAQRTYFEKRKASPHVSHAAELRAAQKAERACEAAVRDALARDRQTLPGMGGEGGDPA